jgi:hypothetical protein
MATTLSSSQRDEYYKWRAIQYAAFVAAFIFWYFFLQKKTGVYGIFGIMAIAYLGVMYFQYESGYVPWRVQLYGGWR